MKIILNKLKIKTVTYYFLLLCFFCGMIKNALILFLIVIIHEIGHIITIKFLNYDIESIVIYPFGGITNINKLINSSITKDIFIAISGVVFQFIVIKLSIIVFPFKYTTINLINLYNKTIIIFNLLPIVPLDGSKILLDVFSYFFSFKNSYFLTLVISILFLILFINYNFIYSLNNYIIVSILIYYIIKYFKDFKYIFNKFLLERIMYKLKYNKIINNTKKITELKKEKLHYFKENNIYINERKKISKRFDKNTYF